MSDVRVSRNESTRAVEVGYSLSDEAGAKHVVRGGSYAEQAWECRAARQRGLDEDGSASYKDYIGFRLWAPAAR